MNSSKANGKDDDEVVIEYSFELGPNKVLNFPVKLQRENLQLLNPLPKNNPEWTRLAHHQCENCPLDKGETHCPAALHMVEVLEVFGGNLSHDEARISITTEHRTYFKQTSLQAGLSSLVGLLMATGGCPVTAKLRPMAFIHTPFSSLEETHFRAVSMYLLAQYLVSKKGGQPDWKLKDLAGLYEEVRVVNRDFSKRLRSTHIQDAGLNAVANLDCFAVNTSFSLSEDEYEELEHLFGPYLKGPKEQSKSNSSNY